MMRSLSKPAKIKKAQQKNQKPQNRTGKIESKKVMKTIFHSPFRYKIQTLSSEDCESVLSTLVMFFKSIRSDIGVEVKRLNNQKFINFNTKAKQQKPVLITQKLTYGIKQCISNIKKNNELIKLIIFFYDENKHDSFEELMCYSIYNKIPYIIMKENQIIKAELGLKKLLSLGILHQELANSLSAYCCRCLIEIPWLVQHQWIPISNNSHKMLNESDQ